jgi:D-alanine--poly(phosphoribitol) ligase subunit 1
VTASAPHVLDLIEPRLASERTAVADGAGTLSYRELDGLSAGLAGALLGEGLALDEPVVVHAHLSRWALIGMLGVLRAGGRYIAVDAAFPLERQQAMTEASGARLVVREPGLTVRLRAPLRAIDADQSPEPGRKGRPGTLAYTCFTSGSTGRPKPVTISARALGYSTATRLAYYGDPVTGFLLCSSISFDSSVAGIYWTLACGGTIVMPSERPSDLAALGRFAAEHRPSHLLAVPSLYGVALRGGLAPRLGSLTTVIVAGETCPPDLVAEHIARLPSALLYNEYGPTECTVWSTVHRCEPADAAASRVPIGRPIPGTRATIHDPAPNGVGELGITGPGLADGEASPYRTGDLVSRRDDGELLFHGRADHQLKLGGVRLERGEIEQALRSFPGVAAAAVGVGHPSGRARLTAYLVTDGFPRPALRAHLLERLPLAAIPARIQVVTALPLLPNGKVDHTELDRLARERRVIEPPGTGSAPGLRGAEIEQHLAGAPPVAGEVEGGHGLAEREHVSHDRLDVQPTGEQGQRAFELGVEPERPEDRNFPGHHQIAGKGGVARWQQTEQDDGAAAPDALDARAEPGG